MRMGLLLREGARETATADLTDLERKLGEVIGLAMAAQVATRTVKTFLGDDKLRLGELLDRLGADACATEERCTAVANQLEGKKAAILQQARATTRSATEMMAAYWGTGDGPLDGLEFLTMVEAGEVGHWLIMARISREMDLDGVRELVDWALPIQQRHYQDVIEASLELVAIESSD